KACSTIFQVEASIWERVNPLTTAPSVASIGVTLGSMRFPPDLEECFQGTIESRAAEVCWRFPALPIDYLASGSAILPGHLRRGPFARVVHLIETRDLNEAIQMAAKIVMSARMGRGGPSHTRSSSHEVLVHDLP